MKSYRVSIQMKAIKQYFSLVLDKVQVVSTFESVDVTPKYEHSNDIC